MDKNKLINMAKEAMGNAYVPYSNYGVGAALLTKTGEIFTGFNIENAAFSLTNCAERTAIFKAYSEGAKEYAAIVVIADAKRPVPPCGACRQVMAELCPAEMPVILTNLHGDIQETTVEQLLPGAFLAEDLV